MDIWQKRISGVVAVGGIVAAILLLAAPYLSQWGEWHEPHAEARYQQLKSGQALTQTFLFEYPRLDGMRLMVDMSQDLPRVGTIQVEVTASGKTQRSEVPVSAVDEEGNVFVAFTHVGRAAVESKGILSLSLTDTKDPVFFRYQIDSTIYEDGEMAHSTRPVQGDLAFAIHYQRPALGTWWYQVAYALLIVGASFVVALGLRHPWWVRSMLGRRDLLWAAVVGVLVFGWYAGWLVRGGVWLGPGDFVKDVSYLTASADALRNGTWPVWSHLTCGGMPLLGNPESSALSLGTVLAMVFPAEQSLWVLLAFEAGVGAVGSFLLARSFGISRTGSAVAALVPVLSGAYPYRIVEGFTMIGAAVAFVPWVLLGVWQAWRKQGMGWTVVAGLGLALMFWRGEVHILAGLLIVLSVLTLIAVGRARSIRPFLVMVVIGSVFFLGGSAKMLAYGELPQFFAAKYRPYVAPLVASRLLDDVFLETHSRFYPVEVENGRRHEEWGNFGAYVGWLVILLTLLGSWKRRKWWWFIAAGFIAAFILSEGTIFYWWLSHWGPLAGLLRIPTRLITIVLVFGGVMAGVGLDRVVGLMPARWKQATIILLCGGMLVSTLTASTFIFMETTLRRVAVLQTSLSQPTLAFHRGILADRHAGILLRQGYLLPKLCADVLAEPDFVAEDKGDSLPLVNQRASLVPNGVHIAEIKGPATIALKERYVPGMVVSQGIVYEGRKGEVVVRVPAGSVGPLDVEYISATRHVQQFLALYTLVLAVGILLLPRRGVS